ncbi:MAG: Rpp14/Pop5 family protein [Candidatus Marsarchaeota archaeon]|nr:Rpp14/Pop5 family protein [Candidatus Marsarchaeota archaeon]
MRDKQRYVLVEMADMEGPEKDVNENEFWISFSRELMKCVGEANYHKINPKFVKSVNKKAFVVRSSLEGTSDFVLATSLMKRLDNSDAAFYTLKSSGTIRALLH